MNFNDFSNDKLVYKDLSYSRTGSNLAKQSLEAGCDASDISKQRLVYNKGFNSIIKSPETTRDEKLLAELGNNFTTESNIDDRSAARASIYILEAIGDFAGGSVGPIIAAVALNAGYGAINPSSQRWIQYACFNFIIKHKETTHDENILAELGQKFATEANIDDNTSGKVSTYVLEAIKECTGASLGVIIAGVTLEGACCTNNINIQRWIHSIGFKAIMDNPKATKEQKRLAGQGFNISCSEKFSDDIATRDAIVILEQLRINK